MPIPQALTYHSDTLADHQLKSFIRTLYSTAANSVGWAKAEGEAHTTSLKRALVLKAMGGADDEDTIKIALEKFEALKADPSSVDADLKLLVYSLSAAHGGADAYADLISIYKNPMFLSHL